MKLRENRIDSDGFKLSWAKNDDFELYNNFQRFHLFELMLNDTFSSQNVYEIMATWIELHFEIKGDAWSGFNSSMRVYNWLRLLKRGGEDISPENEIWQKIEFTLHTHAQHIKSNIEHHIPGNHILLQYFALWLLLISFPKWKLSKKYSEVYEKLLLDEINSEFLECGFHFEQSYHYHVQITLLSLFVLKILKQTERTINTKLENTIQNAVEIVIKFKMPDNILPMFGDNCFNFFNPTLFEDVLQIEKIYKDILDVNAKVNNDLVENYDKQYIVVSTENSKTIFDVGNIGLYCNPGHGHSDISSFVYASQGTTLFIDPGTRNYSNSLEDMSLKKATSHNTISVSGNDQAILWGFFRWANLPKKNICKTTSNEKNIILVNSYEGFPSCGYIKHTRKLRIDNDLLSIEDQIDGNGKHDIEFNFILNPILDVKKKNNKIFLYNANEIWEIFTKGNLDSLEICISDQKVYPAYGVAVQSKKITFRINSANLPLKNEIIVKYIKQS